MMRPASAEPTKACPDCAESVLANARKCRFCGYRFDGEPAVARANEADMLLGLLRRSAPRQTTVPGTLAEWGVELDADEKASDACLAEIDGTTGFVVVTDTRLLFVEAVRASKGPPPVREYPLRELTRVSIVRRRLRRTLAVDWQHSRIVLGALGAKDLDRLYERLRSLAS
jgi:hypothetical protein